MEEWAAPICVFVCDSELQLDKKTINAPVVLYECVREAHWVHSAYESFALERACCAHVLVLHTESVC